MQNNKVIELEGIGKQYPFVITKDNHVKSNLHKFWALDNITLDIFKGEIFGVIGRNGSGKTTLLNIITRVLFSTRGKILINGKVLGLFNLGVGFQDELTGRENIFLNGAILGASKEELGRKLSTIINFSELGDFIDMPLGSYSQGMHMRLAFGIIINLDFDILVIDEVIAVGDYFFQNKCFQQLMDFRRSGKTIVMATQSLDLAERFCDRVALLNHGQLVFCGKSDEAVNKYRVLSSAEKFFVGPIRKNTELVENTKKWVDNISDWGKKLGTKEVIINSVEFINRFGIRCRQIKSQDYLKIKVCFTAKNTVKNLHFGIAIFRDDGVYCYGPNTMFDGLDIPILNPGKGYFVLNYSKLLLAPGEYRLSIAIWDKNETLAFDYHVGYYKLTVVGNKNYGELLNIPYRIINAERNYGFNLFRIIKKPILNLQLLNNKWEQNLGQKGVQPVLLKLLNKSNEEKGTFTTNETVNCFIGLGDSICNNKNYYLWLALYRDDQVCCQNIIYNVGKNTNIEVLFQKFPLLPGGYRVSYGIWDNSLHEFIMYRHGIYKFKMVSQHQDHGTVFLEHNWRYKLPK